MVGMGEILEAINGLVAARYPGEPVYVNLLPKDFERPSTLIEFIGIERADANAATVAVRADFSLARFVEVDGHYLSDMEKLIRCQDEAMELFASGRLGVGDRCLEVRAATGGADFDRSFVDLQFDYFDERPSAAGGFPLIGAVGVNAKNITMGE